MKKRMTWETREIAYVRQYWVVGERLFREDRQDGWYVSSWSDSGHITGYWVEGGGFYQASINWVTGTTADMEIIREIKLDPERERITLEAINQWKNHLRCPTVGRAALDKSAFHLAAA